MRQEDVKDGLRVVVTGEYTLDGRTSGDSACADALAILVERGIVIKDEEGDMQWA